jgi:hypothetical protein
MAPGKFYEIRLEHSYAMRALCTHYTHIPISAVSFKRRHDIQQNDTQHNDTLPKTLSIVILSLRKIYKMSKSLMTLSILTLSIVAA